MIAIGIITLLTILWVVYIWTRKCEHEPKVVVSVATALAVGIFSHATIGLTSGLMPDYSEWMRDGYITKISKKGVIWKTWEGQMQIGTGEMAAIQAPFEFTATSDEMAVKVQAAIGKKVLLSYREWLVMPFRVGDSGYELVSFDLR